MFLVTIYAKDTCEEHSVLLTDNTEFVKLVELVNKYPNLRISNFETRYITIGFDEFVNMFRLENPVLNSGYTI
jgi:hypothetical protein